VTLTADIPDDLLSHLQQAARTEGSSVDDLLARAVRKFLDQRDKVRVETLEGLQAIRRGELVDHSEVRGDFDNWGGRQSSGPA